MFVRLRAFRLWLFYLTIMITFSLDAFVAHETAAQASLPSLDTWHFEKDYVLANNNTCQLNLSPDGFVVGMDASSCSAGANGGMAAATLDVPPSADNRVVVIKVICAGTGGCINGLSATGEGEAAISIDGQMLWSVHCDAQGLCDPLALGDSPTIAFVTSPPTRHRLVLTTTPHVVWSIDDIELLWQTMPEKVQGIAYSPYRDCQNPHFGPFPTAEQIHQDMTTVRHMGNALRTYSSAGVEGLIPAIARQYGLRVSAGAWLGRDRQRNEDEIKALIEISRQVELDSVIVGNEVLLRRDLTEAELISYIQRVKAAVDVPVTTADVAFIFQDHPNLVNELDYVLVHIYAFWEQQPIESAAPYVVDRYHHVQTTTGKRVVIGETGWPSHGPAYGISVASPENQRRFIREFLTLAHEENVEFYYFSAFNELWKTEGGVGAFWGLLDSERHSQYDLQSVLVPMTATVQRLTSNPVPVATGTPPPGSTSTGPVFPVYTDYAIFSETDELQSNHYGPSGFMGDIHTLHVDVCAQVDDSWQNRAILLQYSPSRSDLGGWAGIYWQTPDNNWATVDTPDYNLTEYAQVRFIARAEEEGAQVQFFVGGTDDGPYPSSIPDPIYAQEADSEGFVTLSTEWREFHIDLRGADMHHVIDGFAWVADRFHTPDGVKVYVDNVVYDMTPPPTLPPTPVPPASALIILNGNSLSPDFSLGVDTSRKDRTWLTAEADYYRLNYPAGQDWGVVFIAVGPIVEPGMRETLDLSEYAALAVDLRGEVGGEIVSIGIKDDIDPDDGTETKVLKELTLNWQTVILPLNLFTSADLTRIYIPIEVVFEAETPAQTIYMRDVRYLRNALGD